MAKLKMNLFLQVIFLSICYANAPEPAIEDSITAGKRLFLQSYNSYQAGKYKDALRYLNSAISYSKQADFYGSRGEINSLLGNHKGAIEDYTQALSIGRFTIISGQAQNYMNRGYEYYLLKKYEDAMNDYDSSFFFDSLNVKLFNNRGILYQKLKQFDNAINAFKRAIYLEPYIGESHYLLAKVFIETGDTVSAIASFDKAIFLDDNYAPAYYELGKVFINTNISRAKLYFDAARKIDPMQVDYSFKYGTTIFLLENHSEAIKILKRCNILDSLFTPPLFFLAICYQALGNEEEAMRYFHKFSNKANIPLKDLLKDPVKNVKTAAAEKK